MNRMLQKVVFIIHSLAGGGAEKSVLVLADKMASLGHDVHIIVFYNIIDYDLSNTYKVHCLAEISKYKFVRTLRKKALPHLLKKKIDEIEQDGKIDLILSNMDTAGKVCSKFNLDNLYHVVRNSVSRQIELKYDGRPSRIKAKKKEIHDLYENRNVIAISKGVEDDVRNNFNCQRARIDLIYNGFDVEDIQNKASEEPTDRIEGDYIVHAGRFSPQKRHDLLLRAFSQIKANIKLVLLLDSCKELEELIKANGVEGRVITTGFQRNPYPYLKNAKLSVMCSDYEGFCRSIIEALICGTPVISTDCPSGPNEIFTGEWSRWLVPCNDPIALSQKIDEALVSDVQVDEKLYRDYHIDGIVAQYLALSLP